MELNTFLTYYSLYNKQLGWFLGAGASRSANMPSATDIIWDLKRRYYCQKENREITDNDLSNSHVKDTIQSYFTSLDAPEIWSKNEYSYYFDLVLGSDENLHQRYLEEILHKSKISLTSGSKILASLMYQGLARIVYTTNFDHVLENAYSYMTQENLHSFNLEGAYAVNDALNSEEFPIYAKMHGDFKYTKLKNLPEHLIENDKKIEESLVNTFTRFGMIVCGYSGRDENVMNAFNRILEQNNPFPNGIYWTKPIKGSLFEGVEEFIAKAQDKGVNANIVEIETFDSLMSRIWKIIPKKPKDQDSKIRISVSKKTKIEKFERGNKYPTIRTNLFPIVTLPNEVNLIDLKQDISLQNFSKLLRDSKSGALMTQLSGSSILAWGSKEDYYKIIPKSEINNISIVPFEKYSEKISTDTHIKSFFIRGMVYALLKDKPVVLKRRYRDYYAVVSKKHKNFKNIEPLLKNAINSYRNDDIVRRLSKGIYYMESVEIIFEEFDGKYWLGLRPEIWIEPKNKRRDYKKFIREKNKHRYNKIQNELLDAWKEILLGKESTASISAFHEEIEVNPKFTFSTRTAYSKRL